jgi:hypothetical protein
MQTTINEGTFPSSIRAVSDGSVAGTHFYNEPGGDELLPGGVTVQQEGMSEVRIRFAPAYGIGSFIMGPDETLTVNVLGRE